MAIATFLMARDAGSDLVLLPIVLAARFQNAALLRQAAYRFGPEDLRGRRVGIRAYSQTTGLWLRGSLQEEYGVRPNEVNWVTFEDAHVASFRDPPWAERAPAGSDMLAILREGQLDAAIFGNVVPAAPDLATVFPDPDAAGQAFLARHHFMPINHLVVVRAEIARRDGIVRALLDRFRTAGNLFPFGRAALDQAVTLAVHYATEQGLLTRALTLDEVWAGLPPGCEGQP
ncbi:MAG: ABC transporter substrate-binding protein, partial [Acetobacteraceae bacterium]|nr:ABC transporter substrate-binding protein [Acetobacteraceae bacterium]